MFPPLEPFDTGMLEAGDGHRLYYEQCGNPDGLPVVFLHGGPGSGCSPQHRRLLDPDRFRAVLFDQRGCGRSQPRGALVANTTQHLLADIESLRAHLGIDRWLVMGGSWGSSLGVAYCAAHPERCLGALLRGIFLTGREDIDWFFRGAGALAPEAWATLAAGVEGVYGVEPERLAAQVLSAVHAADAAVAARAVRHWMAWEGALSAPGVAPLPLPAMDAEAMLAAIDKYRVQAHYLAHACFLGEEAVLGMASQLGAMPVCILHGRLDLVCRPVNAWRLHEVAGGSRLLFVDGAGHSPFDVPMSRAIIDALHGFHLHGDFRCIAPHENR
ncbi:prolyl aminopeptidase [Thauera humireducens]|uniref:prolyl aminopeptidase n=1 Tax=Thauera humireducens TaxID=1134435 RepID=UPI00311EA021